MAGTQYKDIPPEWRGDEQVGIARIPEFMISSVNQVAHVWLDVNRSGQIRIKFLSGSSDATSIVPTIARGIKQPNTECSR